MLKTKFQLCCGPLGIENNSRVSGKKNVDRSRNVATTTNVEQHLEILQIPSATGFKVFLAVYQTLRS